LKSKQGFGQDFSWVKIQEMFKIQRANFLNVRGLEARIRLAAREGI